MQRNKRIRIKDSILLEASDNTVDHLDMEGLNSTLDNLAFLYYFVPYNLSRF